MTTLRATRKVLRFLPADGASGQVLPSNALGDWYVTRTVVDRRPLLTIISERCYLPLVVPARDIRSLPDRLPDLVAERLRRVDLPERQRLAEVAAMSPVSVGPTVSRSVTGILVDFVHCLPSYLPTTGWDAAHLRYAEDRLGEMPCHAGRPGDGAVFPNRDAAILIARRWAGQSGR